MATRSALLLKAAIFTITLLFSQSLIAQVTVPGGYLSVVSPDLPAKLKPVNPVLSVPKITVDSVVEGAGSFRGNRRLLNYLKDLGIPDRQNKYQSVKKFYYHLANVFARLRLYPLAMKCFLKAVRVNDPETDSLQLSAARLNMDSAQADDGYLEVSSKDDSIVGEKTSLLKVRSPAKKSRPTSYQHIAGNFNDGKTAVAYALLFHVKQPAPGKRKIFVWANTGHTFITLIKYNTDSTYASASFGFYPKKNQLLSATPVFPTTSATFKDDTEHLWDEVLGKFISKRKFDRILELTKRFEGMEYNLNHQNCTDFGLQAATLAGIHITDTFGRWPLGRGNNPAVTGQSILMGKVHNGDTGKPEPLFIDDTVHQRVDDNLDY